MPGHHIWVVGCRGIRWLTWQDGELRRREKVMMMMVVGDGWQKKNANVAVYIHPNSMARFLSDLYGVQNI